MLTNEQYQAIGELTFQFNRSDGIVEGTLSWVIGTPEIGVGHRIAASIPTFRQRRELLGNVLDELCAIHPLLKPQVDEVKKALVRLDPLASRRNQLIHGLVELDVATQEGRVLSRRRGIYTLEPVACDVQTLHALVEDLTSVARDLNLACLLAIQALGNLRDESLRSDNKPLD